MLFHVCSLQYIPSIHQEAVATFGDLALWQKFTLDLSLQGAAVHGHGALSTGLGGFLICSNKKKMKHLPSPPMYHLDFS